MLRRLAGSADLEALVLALLPEGREQDDPAIGGEAIGDPTCGRSEGEAKLEKPVAEASGQRHPCGRAEGGQAVDDYHAAVPARVVELEQPVEDLVVEFHLGHPVIIASAR
jgi:hypothetical protein